MPQRPQVVQKRNTNRKRRQWDARRRQWVWK